jgi:hypothetical protein
VEVVTGPVVVAPGAPAPPPVFYGLNPPFSYFVYKKAHYLYHDGLWFRAGRHTVLWTAVAIAQVPPPILAVPIEHYKVRPAQWAHHGPPPWAHERDRERGQEKGHGRGHDKEEARHDRGHGKDRD